MKEIKVIFCQSEELLKNFKKSINFDVLNTTDKYIIFKGSRVGFESEEEIILVYYVDFVSAFNYLNENFDVFKFIFAGISHEVGNFDLKGGDVIIPNTYIGLDDKDPIFIEYSASENYDLTKFGLILNGLCVSRNISDEEMYDIYDENIYDNLKILSDNNLISKTVCVFGIELDSNESVYENTVSIANMLI